MLLSKVRVNSGGVYTDNSLQRLWSAPQLLGTIQEFSPSWKQFAFRKRARKNKRDLVVSWALLSTILRFGLGMVVRG